MQSVGVLALQGSFSEHLTKLAQLTEVLPVAVKTVAERRFGTKRGRSESNAAEASVPAYSGRRRLFRSVAAESSGLSNTALGLLAA